MSRAWLFLGLVLVAGCGGGPERAPASAVSAPSAAVDVGAIKPFILEKDGAFQALIDVAPVWAQVEARGDAAARKAAVFDAVAQVIKRDGAPKFPQAKEFQVKVVRVTEYDSYNRPMFATGKPLCDGKFNLAQPAAAALVWTEANLQ